MPVPRVRLQQGLHAVRRLLCCEQLAKAGYDYYGNETMYSGISGEVCSAHARTHTRTHTHVPVTQWRHCVQPFGCDIFMGVVFYQRLRHMVSDKFQAPPRSLPAAAD